MTQPLSEMLIAVIDTNVVVAAFRSRHGASFRIIDDFMMGRSCWQWSVSHTSITEYEAVLLRQGFGFGVVAAFLDDVVLRADRVHQVLRLRPVVTDPGDEFLAELALTACVDYLVTFNTSDFHTLPLLGVQLATPAEFLKITTNQ